MGSLLPGGDAGRDPAHVVVVMAGGVPEEVCGEPAEYRDHGECRLEPVRVGYRADHERADSEAEQVLRQRDHGHGGGPQRRVHHVHRH